MESAVLPRHWAAVWPSPSMTWRSTSVAPWRVHSAVCSRVPCCSRFHQSTTDETSSTHACRRYRSLQPLEDTGWPWCGLERSWSDHKYQTKQLQLTQFNCCVGKSRGSYTARRNGIHTSIAVWPGGVSKMSNVCTWPLALV